MSSYIGCFTLSSDRFDAIINSETSLSKAVCSSHCLGLSYAVFGLSSAECGCLKDGILPSTTVSGKLEVLMLELTVRRRRRNQLHLALYPVETTLVISVAVRLRLGRCLSPTTPVRDQLRPQQVIGQQQALAKIGL